MRLAICRHPGGARLRRRQHHLGFAVRAAAFRLRLSVPQAILRPPPVLLVWRRHEILIAAQSDGGDMRDFVIADCELTAGAIAALTGAKLRAGDPAERPIPNNAPPHTPAPH